MTYARFIREMRRLDLQRAKKHRFYEKPRLAGLNRWQRKQAISKAKRGAITAYRRWYAEIGASGRRSVRQWDMFKANPQAIMRSMTRRYPEIAWRITRNDFSGAWVIEGRWLHDWRAEPLRLSAHDLGADIALPVVEPHPNAGKRYGYRIGTPKFPLEAISEAIRDILHRFGMVQWVQRHE